MLLILSSRFFTQSQPLQKTNFFNMLGDHQSDNKAPSLPLETNEEDDQMNDKDISYHVSFGLDSVLQRAEAKALNESGDETSSDKSPYGSFRSKLNMFKSGFQKSTINCSAKSRNQFKPVRAKQVKLEKFKLSSQATSRPLPNTNFFDEVNDTNLKVEKRPPSLPPDTHEEDDQMETKSLTKSELKLVNEPALPSLCLDNDIFGVDSDSEISENNNGIQSRVFHDSQKSTQSDTNRSPMVVASRSDSTMTTEKECKASSGKKSCSIINMFKKCQSTDKKHPIYTSADSLKGQESNFHKRPDGESGEMVDLTNEESNEANKSVSLHPQVYLNTQFVLVLQLTNKLYQK